MSDADPQELDIVTAHEPWTECLLEDGSVLRIKTVIKQVFRHPNGELIWTSQQIGVVRTARRDPTPPDATYTRQGLRP